MLLEAIYSSLVRQEAERLFREEEAAFLAELAEEEERLYKEMLDEDSRLREEEEKAALAEEALIAAEEEVRLSVRATLVMAKRQTDAT